MRPLSYDPDAARQTVSVTLNSDLYARAKSLGLNVSRVAEQALAEAYARECATRVAEEMKRDLAAIGEYEHVHGSFADFARAQYASDDDPV